MGHYENPKHENVDCTTSWTPFWRALLLILVMFAAVIFIASCTKPNNPQPKSTSAGDYPLQVSIHTTLTTLNNNRPYFYIRVDDSTIPTVYSVYDTLNQLISTTFTGTINHYQTLYISTLVNDSTYLSYSIGSHHVDSVKGFIKFEVP